MTEPTDAEIDALLRPFYESDDAAEMAKYDDRLTARAVLAKWGTPQPTQAQAGAVPLTDAQSHALIERMANEAEQWAEGLSYEPTQEQLSGWCVAFIQREIHFAHGIKQGGQHG